MTSTFNKLEKVYIDLLNLYYLLLFLDKNYSIILIFKFIQKM